LISVTDFLRGVAKIEKAAPKYKLGHDGSDGYCDCIGLIIGGIRRAGGKWSGTHGSNYAMRYAVSGVTRVTSTAELQAGQIVAKARASGSTAYALPKNMRQERICWTITMSAS